MIGRGIFFFVASATICLAEAPSAWGATRRTYPASKAAVRDALLRLLNNRISGMKFPDPINDHGDVIDTFYPPSFFGTLKHGCSFSLSSLSARQTQLEINCRDYRGQFGTNQDWEDRQANEIAGLLPAEPAPPAAEADTEADTEADGADSPDLAAEQKPAPAERRAKPKRGAAAKRSDLQPPGGPKPERPEDFALVIGIERYYSVEFPADYGERDAESARRYFRWLGVPEENIVTLTGADASRTGIAKYLEEWLPRNVSPQSRVYFYFSGHGGPEPASGTAYLLPWDGDPAFLKTTGYALSRLYENLQRLTVKEVLVFLDACFSGAGGRSGLAKGSRPLVNVRVAAPAGPKLSVLAAASESEITVAMDEKGHGLFTYHVFKGLGGEADGDRDGHVSLAELHAYVQQKVQRAARRQNREQTPQLFSIAKNLKVY